MFASKGDILSLDASAPVLTRQTFAKSGFRPTKPILCCQSEPLDSHSQLFQSFLPITDIATYRLNLPRGQFI